MTLFDRIQNDLKQAMKAGEKEKVGVYRMTISEIKRLAIDEGKRDEITDELVIAALSRSAKRRKESIEQYRSAGREDLAAREEEELALLSRYLPAPFSEEELEILVMEAIRETGAAGKKDMGKVMKAVMPKVQGRADGKQVQRMVLDRLE